MWVYLFLLIALIGVYSIYAAWEFSRASDADDIIGKRCSNFWASVGLVQPRQPTQAELSRKALANKPPQAFDQNVTHTLVKGRANRATNRGITHVNS